MDQLFSKLVVITFPDEKKAYEGVRALRELHDEGIISLYGYAVLHRGEDGALSVKDSKNEGPIGTGVGALTGALIGLFAGPVGAVIGLGIGTAVGATRDLIAMGVNTDFIEEISEKLPPGTTAIATELSEDWLTPLDTRMEAVGGTVMRQWRDDFVDDEMEKSLDKARGELTRRRAEFATQNAQQKDALKKELAGAEEKLQAALDKANARLQQYGEQVNAKVQALQEQAQKANAQGKARIEQRIASIRADGARRREKLEQARKLALEALKP